jgi:hypothetical protein
VDFEGGSLGSIAQGSNAFQANSQTYNITYSNTQTNSGSLAAKFAWDANNVGAGEYGIVDYPGQVSSGGEVWVRAYFYFGTPWSWASYNGQYSMIKILRGAATNVGGFLSVFADSSGTIVLSNEPGDKQTLTNSTFDIGKWQCIEMYVKLSPTQGVFRIWKNGVLIAEDKSTRTLNGGTYAACAYMMSQWNNGVSQNQNMYMDDIVVTSDRPSQVDAQGNPMIGPISGSASLAAPTGLKVIN